MGVLEDKIAAFLDIGHGDGDGYGHGNGFGDGFGFGYGFGNGNGDGYDHGYGYGNGFGNGDGYGYGDGHGDSYGFGHGYGHGYGHGDGHGHGHGDGYGFGNGFGDGDGYGDGHGDGYGVKSIDGYTLHNIDGVPTAITSLHGNYAKGFTLEANVVKKPCYIAKVGNYFAHGDTLKEAMEDARSKYEQNRPLSERIADFKEAYPTLDTEAEASDLFRWHNILTGSCLFGRKQFCEQHNVDYESGKWKIRDFFKLCKDAYGSESIIQAMQAYK